MLLLPHPTLRMMGRTDDSQIKTAGDDAAEAAWGGVVTAGAAEVVMAFVVPRLVVVAAAGREAR